MPQINRIRVNNVKYNFGTSVLRVTPYANRTPNDVKNEQIDACGSGDMMFDLTGINLLVRLFVQ